MVKVGEQAPDFTAVNDRGETVRLSDFRGRKVVLYFYPKDDTPGCTREACSFRDDYGQLQEAGAVVLGVSPDPVESHVKFREKYGLPFPLLSDPDHQVAEAYGVWKEKRMYGRTYWGIERTTFVLDEEGKVLAVIRGVKPEEHPRRALKALGAA
ncbi:thioredoxin-dependent thiol peroxidase [Thermaerobacter sp. PB12/4term]|uniref:thioredoxin-dependent thiol peroxidase n=1 Tax=Thermaerobacter sp. PB12/4term TaxID=2293838 RepID=UPI000E3276E0|nr:thioredoxin-dependent thiol peroxidase [Thermaerobacter sp. PB12/4term]QIA26383.1 thioredoxin-dependent thiol peroxidase [Thermaerobacter sp. PB12/4term]